MTESDVIGCPLSVVVREDVITVFLADDSTIVREGVRAMIVSHPDLEVVGTASDYDGLVRGATETAPRVIVADVRMPPNFRQEGIDACHVIRKLRPHTGVVILSQYDDPDYAVDLLAGGAAGYAYLLKDRVADGDQLVRAIRQVATGGSMLDSSIIDALIQPVQASQALTPEEEDLVTMIAAGRSINAIAAACHMTPSATADKIDRLWVHLAQEVSSGSRSALRRLRRLHEAIVRRDEQGAMLSRLVPSGLAEWLTVNDRPVGQSERLEVTVLMSDIRGFSTIAELADPSLLATQLNEHHALMNRAVLEVGGTIMQYTGDGMTAVFGAPVPTADHAQRALRAALAMQAAQHALNQRWTIERRVSFSLGIGLSSGLVAAALLGSAERHEYALVGDPANLCQRLQQIASGGEVVMSQATLERLDDPPPNIEALEARLVKGRQTLVRPYRVAYQVAATTT